jgi:hypothetical protein
MALETIFEVAGFITPEDVLYFRMLARYEPKSAERFEFVFEIRGSKSVMHEFIAIAEFGGSTPNVQFHLPRINALTIALFSCIAKEAISPIIVCYDKDPDKYLNSLKTKGLRDIGATTIVYLLDCFTGGSESLQG